MIMRLKLQERRHARRRTIFRSEPGASRLYVTLLAEDGTELLTKTVKLNVNRDVPEMFIGILSDHPEGA